MSMPARSRVITTGLVAVAVSVRVVRIVVGPVAVAAEMGVQSAVSATDPTDVASVTEAADVPTAHTTPHMAATAPVAAASTATPGKCICRSEASCYHHRQHGNQGHPLQTFVHVNSI